MIGCLWSRLARRYVRSLTPLAHSGCCHWQTGLATYLPNDRRESGLDQQPWSSCSRVPPLMSGTTSMSSCWRPLTTCRPSTYWIGGATTSQCIRHRLLLPTASEAATLRAHHNNGQTVVSIESRDWPIDETREWDFVGIIIIIIIIIMIHKFLYRHKVVTSDASVVVVLPQCCVFGYIHPPTRLLETVHADRNRTCVSNSVFPHYCPLPINSSKHCHCQHALYLVLYGKHGKLYCSGNDCSRGWITSGDWGGDIYCLLQGADRQQMALKKLIDLVSHGDITY